MKHLPIVPLLTVMLLTVPAAAHRSVPVYDHVVERCLDALMAHGLDTYGPETTPVLVSIIDLETLTCPQEPPPLDEPWRVIRRHRRNPAGADLATDMPTLTVMHARGGAYADFALRYARYYLNHMKSERGLVCWGWHDYYDVYTDRCHVHQHELHAGVDPMDWKLLFEADREATLGVVENIWRWHVIDKKTGEINRHGDGKRGCDFSMSAGAYIEAFAHAYAETSDKKWVDRARLLANYYWERRNPETNLFPERPNAGMDRFDGSHFVTAITGPYCGALLRAYELTQDALFLDHALTYLRAYGQYGYDQEANAYWGSLCLDGMPNDEPTEPDGYGKYEPRGYLDLWKPYCLGYQHPLLTGLSYLEAYRLTRAPDMLSHAKRFGYWVVKARPGEDGIRTDTWYGEYAKSRAEAGAYAGMYGRAIALLTGLYHATDEHCTWLRTAKKYGDLVIEKLQHESGLLRGHPEKDYYEAVDGVGELLRALSQLEDAKPIVL
ncbi:MAG: hypothetical protein ACLFTT_16430 [Candidatus Hydrogenedentota bacterium]